jgi:hypothetical protein
MTTALLASLAGLGSLSDPSHLVQRAFLRLQSERELTLTATASERRGNRRIVQEVTVGFVHRPGQGDVRLELTVHEGGLLVQRIAADGTRIWCWEARGDTYLSRPYGNDDGLLPDWRLRLFSFLRAQTSGVSSFVARVLTDAYEGLTSQGQPWRPWIPTARLERSQGGVRAVAASPVPAVTTYVLDPKDGADAALTRIVHETTLRAGESEPALRWRVEIHPGRLPHDVQFGFTPPKGSRARTSQTGA